ncbi:hypothetical protein BTS2_0339 [Bacillus sp. TS-2]|nr:hypothetical protein BTS2_0339 [Bacillus sp. TS-2]
MKFKRNYLLILMVIIFLSFYVQSQGLAEELAEEDTAEEELA